ncbi:tRNA (N6-threonylcarbamoyladenosine(37)-N6)-methyltransferase TrmO [Desulfohalovibrio reitneri]|uniref:tRNA (N6-threonylcarbamoyladenosine(37)-N6)-methyltransferase TrmO n=1 Tax=Desulfohalovibrio reitneri TaxID=1307759 RepID=UPI0004A7356D|nr:tRNA (N6-threonylcarbamoyladenosine(37)-N6)-methyltransferase TrmO [Desulfohalovibrio reitneri]
MDAITYHPIGVLRSPHAQPEGMPIQPAGARGERGRVELDPRYAPALADLDGFSHVYLLYHFHRAGPYSPEVTPFLDGEPKGLFATRAPTRPNPIGISVLRLERVEGGVAHLLDVDVLDGTPVLDIKPYVPRFDAPHGEVRSGWLEAREGEESARSDGRFA